MTRLSDIRAREQAATPGPWEPSLPAVLIINPMAGVTGRADFYVSIDGHKRVAEAAANFIAHARADIPYLLSLIDEIAARPEDVRGILEREGIDVPPSQTP